MDRLARYYTEEIVSDLLIDALSDSKPEIIIDLGIGNGSLSYSALKKWSDAKIIAADIDTIQIKKTIKLLPKIKVFEANGLNKNINKKLNIKFGTVDVAICNPPYLRITSKHEKYLDLFENIGFHNCKNLKYYTSDLIFLAQNLFFLKDGGELGIILPDGLLSSNVFKYFRHDLVTNHSLISSIQLPDKIFKNTEARTHILIIRKGVTLINHKTTLYLSNLQGQLIESIEVSQEELVERMDFSYHKFQKANSTNLLTLKDIGANIIRGSVPHSILKVTTGNYLHTTNMEHLKEMVFDNNIEIHNNFTYALKGDIILARVGRGCIGKVSLLKSGLQVISDCVYRIRVPEEHLSSVWKSFCSEKGQFWLKSHSKGTCAKLINKIDLLNFPIYGFKT